MYENLSQVFARTILTLDAKLRDGCHGIIIDPDKEILFA